MTNKVPLDARERAIELLKAVAYGPIAEITETRKQVEAFLAGLPPEAHSVSAAIAEVERLRDEWDEQHKLAAGDLYEEGAVAALNEAISKLRALPPDARAVDGDAREVAREIVSKSAETRYLTSKGVDVLCSEENLINAIAAAITATNKD